MYEGKILQKFVNCAFYGLDTEAEPEPEPEPEPELELEKEPEPQPKLVKSRNRTANKVTIPQHWFLCFIFSRSPSFGSFPLSLQVSHTNENFKNNYESNQKV
jgi:hypothetical protein